jgi:DNA-binding NarL/FixJ family response regulator
VFPPPGRRRGSGLLSGRRYPGFVKKIRVFYQKTLKLPRLGYFHFLIRPSIILLRNMKKAVMCLVSRGSKGGLTRSRNVIIARSSSCFARDIQGKILSHDSIRVMTSKNEDELKTHIKNMNPALVLIEECFRVSVTAYLIGRIHDKYPKIRIAVFSYTGVDPDRLAVFLNSGAVSFINFRLETEEYMKGLNTVISGNIYFPEDVRLKIEERKTPPLDRVTLTRREIEILALLVDGCRLDKAAASLGIAKGTAKIHKKHVYAKCGAHNLIELVKFVYDTDKLKAALGGF